MDKKKEPKKREYLSWGAPDGDGETNPPMKQKARSSHYLRWGDPDEVEETVPRKTLTRLSTATEPHVQAEGSFQYDHDYSSDPNNQSSLEQGYDPEETTSQDDRVVSAPRSSARKSVESSDDGTSESVLVSPSFPRENKSGESSDYGSSDTEYCINIHGDSSEDDTEDIFEDEYGNMEPPERHFIPVENPLHQPCEPFVLPAIDNLSHPELETQESRFNPEERPSEGVSQVVSSSVSDHQSVNSGTPAYLSTLTQLLTSKYTEMIASNVCVSRREILLNVLNLTNAHDVNNTLFIGICKLINSIFNEPILPDTTFKLDSLLLSTCGMQYHFYCSKCLKLLHNPNLSEFVTCGCEFVNDLSDLTKAKYFITFDICTQLELILRDPQTASLLVNIESYNRVTPGMHDLWDGDVFQKFIKSLDFRDGATHISFVFCFDGAPLYKSSNCEVWPLLGIINELPPLVRMKKTFIIGMYFGDKKPDFNTFFKPVVARLTNLSNHGATINVGGKQTFVKVHCIGGCVDSGARGPVQGIHLHNGENGCSWCLHPGETEGGGSSARKYKYLHDVPALRTHQQVASDAKIVKRIPPRAASAPKPHVNGVIASSPLLKLPHFDIVDGMVLDVMHNSYLGVTRQFLRLWCGLDGNVKLPDGSLPSYYIGSPSTEEKINKRIAGLIPPSEVRRLPRPITDLVHFKARELENFLLYFLVPVLKGILKDKFIKHMILYVQGMYLLMKDVVLPEDLATAEYLLDQFVQETENLYENENFSQFKQYTYNVHLSLHAVQNARRWGSAWSVSGYAFENAIGVLKKVVHANKGIPFQVARALCKMNVQSLLSQEITSARCASFLSQITPQKNVSMTFVNNVRVFGLSANDFEPNEEEAFLLRESAFQDDEFSTAKKILFNNALFSPRLKNTTRTRNDFAQLTDGQFIQIKQIIVSESLQAILLFCSFVHVEPCYPVHLPPHLTLKSPFLFNVQLIEQEQHLIAYDIMSKPCVYCNLKSVGGGETITVMANIYNIF